MLSKLTLVAAATAVGLAAADQGQYAQCGGINYSGSTTCSSGLVCSKVNDYYSQCLAGTAGTSNAAAPAPSTVVPTAASATKAPTTVAPPASSAAVTAAPDSSNPFSGYQIYANSYYASEVISLAVPTLGALAAKASAVANTGTFVWMDTMAKVSQVDDMMADITAKNKAGASPPIIGNFVVYDLPDRDCAALASNGELSIANDGAAKYQQYIDSIAAVMKKYPSTKVVLVIEPDSLGNLVTNMNVAKCASAAATYKSSVTYAMKTLNLPNVSMYLDAGHAGWLGWSANIGPAAQLFGELFKAAGSPAAVRGLVTNVSNYNAFSIATCPSYTQGDANCDEKRYINALAPLLVAQGFPAHFITDTARNGVQPTAQLAWGDWCNVAGAGFGARPSTNTGDALVDAFVWVKPGGESDGTSNTTSPRYDAHCGNSDSLKPAPEAGTWFGAYFEQLLKNANPAF